MVLPRWSCSRRLSSWLYDRQRRRELQQWGGGRWQVHWLGGGWRRGCWCPSNSHYCVCTGEEGYTHAYKFPVFTEFFLKNWISLITHTELVPFSFYFLTKTFFLVDTFFSFHWNGKILIGKNIEKVGKFLKLRTGDEI